PPLRDAMPIAKVNPAERTVEILKQGLHEPLPVEKQVMIIYALTKGYLDDIPVKDITRFESEFHVWLDEHKKELLAQIRDTGQLPDADDMNGAVESFKKTFLPTDSE